MDEYATIDAYIHTFPPKVQEMLLKMRQTIHAAAPEATEAISYGIPTFKLQGNLVHFGGFKDHVSFFPGPGGIDQFQKELTPYKTSKGTIQFTFDKPIPYDLVRKITIFRVQQNTKKK